MSSATNINCGVSDYPLRGSSMARNIELTIMTQIDMVSNIECIMIIYAPLFV
jgi:hypothetical protein